MIRVIPVILLSLVLAGPTLAGPLQIYRLHLPPGPIPAELRTRHLDIATCRPGQFMDVVIRAEERSDLAAFGYPLEIIEEDLEKKLRGVDWEEDYHTYAETVAELDQLELDHPDLCRVLDLGDSTYQRDILMLKISDDVQQEEDEAEVLIYCGIHAREIIAPEIGFHYIHHLLDGYGTDPVITWLVDNREIYIVPMLNPDGHVQVESDIDWRKNGRDNNSNGVIDSGDGVDLNRNFGYMWGYDDSGSSPIPSSETYRGPAAFSEPEAQALQDWTLDHQARISFGYHSYGELYAYAWSYTDLNTPDHATFQYIYNQNLSLMNGYEAGNALSGTIYNSNGGTKDWLYGDDTGGRLPCFDATVEVGTEFYPPASQIPILCQTHLGPNLFITKAVGTYLEVSELLLDDAAGDGDGLLDSGETVTLELQVENIGLEGFSGGTVSLTCPDPLLAILDGTADLDLLAPMSGGSTAAPHLSVACNPLALDGHVFDGLLQFSDGERHQQPIPIQLVVNNRTLALILDERMDLDPGWFLEGEWAWGQPTGQGGEHGSPDPSSGFSGANVLGYNLTGDYGNSIPEYHLTTPPLDCSQAIGIHLTYRRWLGVESPTYDHARLQLSTSGGASWVTLWENSDSLEGGAWELREHDLSTWADQQPDLRLRWTMGPTDSSWAFCGWNIDDVVLSGYGDAAETPTPPPTWTPPPPTATPSPEPTATGTPSPSPPPSPTTPPSPTPAPTLTPVPELAYRLEMPDLHLTPGETFLLERFCSAPGGADLILDEYVILEVSGDFWFWPDWEQELAGVAWTLPAGSVDRQEILRFPWPTGAGSMEGLRFWGALLQQGSLEDLLIYHMVEWGFGA